MFFERGLKMGQSIQKWIKSNFLKAVFHKFYLVHSWILSPKYRNSNSIESRKFLAKYIHLQIVVFVVVEFYWMME